MSTKRKARPTKPTRDSAARGAKPLTPRQARFVSEYGKDLNATQAARRAGYSAKSADKIGPRLVGESRISAAIDTMLAKSAHAAGLDVARVDREIAAVAMVDVRRLFRANGSMLPINEWPSEIAAAVASIETSQTIGRGKRRKVEVRKIRLWDKVAALTLAARRLGLLRDKIDVRVDKSLEELVAASMGDHLDNSATKRKD